jgi:hypothetical protein
MGLLAEVYFLAVQKLSGERIGLPWSAGEFLTCPDGQVLKDVELLSHTVVYQAWAWSARLASYERGS